MRANPEVAQASAVYIGGTKWQDPEGGKRIDASVIGFDPDSGIFTVPDILAQSDVLERPDTVLVDRQTRAIFGPLDTGRVVDLNGHKVTIGGRYTLGTGFLGLAVVLASEDTFFRIFGTGPRPRPRDTVNLGLVTLKPGRRPRQGGAARCARFCPTTRRFSRAPSWPPTRSRSGRRRPAPA